MTGGLALLASGSSRAATDRPSSCEAALAFFARGMPTVPKMIRASIHRAHGLPWAMATVAHDKNHPRINTVERARRIFAKDVLSFEARYEGSAYFHARFAVRPNSFMSRELDHRLGIPPTGFVFGMFPTDEEFDHFANVRPAVTDAAHVDGALGYVRFYDAGDQLIITEIQSDAYGLLSENPITRGRYRAWARLLTLSFERYAARLFERRDVRGSIVWPGAAYPHQRWHGHDEPVPTELVRMLYDRLPRRLGYEEHDCPRKFEWPGHRDERARNKIPLGCGWIRAIDPTPPPVGTARREVFDHLMIESEHGFNRAFAELVSLVKEPATGGLVPRIKPADAYAIGFEAIDINLPGAADDVLQKIWSRVRRAAPAWVQNPELRALSVVSGARAGSDEATRSQVKMGASEYAFSQWPGEDRHPCLESGAGPGALCVKGGGRRSLRGDIKNEQNIFAHSEAPIESHRVWGGLLEPHGRHELINHLWLHHLGSLAGVRLHVPIPIDLGRPLAYPRRARGAVRLVSEAEYLRRELKNSDERLVQMRTWVREPRRVAAVRQIFFDHPDQFPELLGRIYRAYGQRLVLPDESPGVRASHAERLAYLDRIYELNREAAERIVISFTRRTLTTIGLVHGYGGHLGGTQSNIFDGEAGEIVITEQTYGAPSGGSTHMRNLTLAGEVRDLDENVYLPEAPLRSWPRLLLKHNLDYFQKEDLRHWREAFFWFTLAVRGLRAPPKQTLIPALPFGDPNDGGVVVYDNQGTDEIAAAYVRREVGRFDVLAAGRRAGFSLPALEQTYRAAFTLGQSTPILDREPPMIQRGSR